MTIKIAIQEVWEETVEVTEKQAERIAQGGGEYFSYYVDGEWADTINYSSFKVVDVTDSEYETLVKFNALKSFEDSIIKEVLTVNDDKDNLIKKYISVGVDVENKQIISYKNKLVSEAKNKAVTFVLVDKDNLIKLMNNTKLIVDEYEILEYFASGKDVLKKYNEVIQMNIFEFDNAVFEGYAYHVTRETGESWEYSIETVFSSLSEEKAAIFFNNIEKDDSETYEIKKVALGYGIVN